MRYLKASIKSEELGDLTNLTDLDLSGNDLNGDIPEDLGDLTNLSYLDVSNNNLTSLSESVKMLRKLTLLIYIKMSPSFRFLHRGRSRIFFTFCP